MEFPSGSCGTDQQKFSLDLSKFKYLSSNLPGAAKALIIWASHLVIIIEQVIYCRKAGISKLCP